MQATAAGLDLTGLQLIDFEHSHQAAARACEMAAKGQAAAIMKGALHTDELLEAVVRGHSSLRTDRRISHVFVLGVPSCPLPLLVSDAALNIAPDWRPKGTLSRTRSTAPTRWTLSSQGRHPVRDGDGEPEDVLDT